MTTTVVVKANHGWPVDVTPFTKNADDPAIAGPTTRVPPDTEMIFSVHNGKDLLIHEVQPDETA